MTETAFSRFWELVLGAIALNPEAFALIHTLPLGTEVALSIMLITGLSHGIGQSIVLFVNRVKPIRFVLSLLIMSILYMLSSGFWLLSVWLASQLFDQGTPFIPMLRTLGLAYAPLMLGFLVALPYFGVPILVLLSLWTLLAFVVGFNAAAGIDPWQAFWCSALGWAVFQILQRTIGRPATVLSQWLTNTTAGVKLVMNIQTLEQILVAGAHPTTNPDNNVVDPGDEQ